MSVKKISMTILWVMCLANLLKAQSIDTIGYEMYSQGIHWFDEYGESRLGQMDQAADARILNMVKWNDKLYVLQCKNSCKNLKVYIFDEYGVIENSFPIEKGYLGMSATAMLDIQEESMVVDDEGYIFIAFSNKEMDQSVNRERSFSYLARFSPMGGKMLWYRKSNKFVGPVRGLSRTNKGCIAHLHSSDNEKEKKTALFDETAKPAKEFLLKGYKTLGTNRASWERQFCVNSSNEPIHLEKINPIGKGSPQLIFDDFKEGDLVVHDFPNTIKRCDAVIDEEDQVLVSVLTVEKKKGANGKKGKFFKNEILRLSGKGEILSRISLLTDALSKDAYLRPIACEYNVLLSFSKSEKKFYLHDLESGKLLDEVDVSHVGKVLISRRKAHPTGHGYMYRIGHRHFYELEIRH